MPGYRTLLVAGVTPWFALALRAQTPNQARAFAALLNTPIGALPPMVNTVPFRQGQGLSGLSAAYSRYSQTGTVDIDNVGASADFGTARQHGEITAGMRSCSGCNDLGMVGASYYAELSRASLGSQSSSMMTVGVMPAVGVGHSSGTDPWFWSGAVNLPVALSARLGDALRVEPFVQPGAGYGMIAQTGNNGGAVRALIGGGVGLYTTSGIGLHVGMQKIIETGSGSQWGLGLSYRGW